MANGLLDQWELLSPDGNIHLKVITTSDGEIQYSVYRKNTVIFGNSPLGINTSVADFTSGLTFMESAERTISESYPMVCGKKAIYSYACNEIILKFRKNSYIIYMIFRAQNDGVAYRYYIPGEGRIFVYYENSGYVIPSDAYGWAMEFVVNYEGFYLKRTNDELLKGTFGMPLLLNIKDNWILLSEAAVYSTYCGCHIEGVKDTNILKVVFAPDQKNAIITEEPFYTPWRVAIIGELSDIVESTIIESLNPDCEYGDTTWIKSGRSAWSWWSGDSTKDYAIQTKYIDFAHKMGWEYYLCDAGWQASWLPELVEYAREKDIGIFVWYDHKELKTDEDIYDKFSWLASLGVKGIKVDFFDSDCQERISVYDKIAIAAYKYHLMVVYHGATKPSGERRRWPHIMTREGILGAEYYKWSDGPTAEHNCTVPFTRNAVGPMDYTPVIFSKEIAQTTRAHQLALGVIFESNIQHFADKPEAYENIGEALDFLKKCPATWDDTLFIDGYPGKYVTIARKSSGKWFIGSICGGNISRTVSINLSFLGDGEYIADIYEDDSAMKIQHLAKKVDKNMRLEFPIEVNGGCVIQINQIIN
ncbi:MAG: alpha-glucosidase [Clostridiales bacterium]|nr:alpha-glucosidase [Clostridiales bacterium]